MSERGHSDLTEEQKADIREIVAGKARIFGGGWVTQTENVIHDCWDGDASAFMNTPLPDEQMSRYIRGYMRSLRVQITVSVADPSAMPEAPAIVLPFDSANPAVG
jgi:hypothetical protein